MKGLVFLAALAVPGAASAELWWQGIWAAEAEWCAAAGQIGAVTPAPIAITDSDVLGYENTCDIRDVQEMDSAGAVHLRLSCQSEGSTFDEDRLVMRTDETGLAIWVWFGAGEPILFQRCE